MNPRPVHVGTSTPHAGSVLWLILILILALPRGDAFAQRSATRVWMQAGPAATTLGAGAHASVGAAFDQHVLAVRGATTDSAPDGETWDLGLLYGRALTLGRIHVWGGTGVAVVGGRRYGRLFGDGNGEPFDPMIGFPLEANVAWAPTTTLALALYAFVDVNTAHPFGGVGVSIRAGWLR